MFGMHVHGFPNMFILGHTQGGFTVNYPHLLDEASTHLCHLLGYALDQGVREIEVTSDAEADWVQTLAHAARDIRAFQEQCTPGYYNSEGNPDRGGFLVTSYGKGPMAFFRLLADWRAANDFAGLELRR